MSWILLWKFVLVISIGCFALMAIIVSIGGASDIRRLFQHLREDEKE